MLKNVFKFYAVVLVFLTKSTFVLAQAEPSQPNQAIYLRYSADYFSKKYGGFQTGFQHQFSERTTSKVRKNGSEKIRFQSRLWEVQLGYNRHRQEANSVAYLSGNLIFKKMRPNGFFREHIVGVGIQRNILDGQGWDVTEGGSVVEIKNHGYWSALPQYAFSLGWDFRKTRLQLPLSVIANSSLHFQFPYNGNVLPRPKLNLGFTYHF